jgi:hypothetical protein
MPWVRKHHRSTPANWIVGIIGGLLIGLLLGYERWGSTAAVVSIVEKEMSATEARIKDAENRLNRLETKLLTQEGGRPAAEGAGSVVDAKNGVTHVSVKSTNDPLPPTRDTY